MLQLRNSRAGVPKIEFCLGLPNRVLTLKSHAKPEIEYGDD